MNQEPFADSSDLEEACKRYKLTIDEFLSWQRLIERHGFFVATDFTSVANRGAFSKSPRNRCVAWRIKACTDEE